MARPEKAIDWNKVEQCIQFQCSAIEISGILGVDSDTFYRRFKKHYKQNFQDFTAKKSQSGKGLLKIAQFQKALKGNSEMLKWLGEHVLGQKKTSEESKPRNDDNLNFASAYIEAEAKRLEAEQKIKQLEDRLNAIESKANPILPGSGSQIQYMDRSSTLGEDIFEHLKADRSS